MAGYAVGLGRLTVSSAQGHPFKAEIELVAVKKEDKSSLMARLASQETFRQANIDYSSVLSTFKTSIETRSDGQPYVRIISPQPIVEPFLNMLIELISSSGRLLREYTVLPSSSEKDVHLSTESVIAKSDASVKQDEKLSIQKESDSANKAHTAYGPVKQGDTLARIAKNIVLPSAASFNQMLVALQRANCDAFFGNNMNQLKTGPILRIPDNSEITAITPAEADLEVKAQAADWYRRRFADIERATEEEPKKSVSGRIESAVEVNTTEVNTAPAQVLPSEILKLSKGEVLGNESTYISNNIGGGVDPEAGGEVGGKEPGAERGLHAMEEDTTEKPGSLDETSGRIKKNVGEQQRLLELGNPALTNIQQQAKAFEPVELDAAISAQSPASAAEAASSAAEVNNPAELTVASTATAPSKTNEPVGTVPKSLQVQVASLPSHIADRGSNAHSKNSIADNLAANIEYVGGTIVLLITGMVGVSMVRRHKGK